MDFYAENWYYKMEQPHRLGKVGCLGQKEKGYLGKYHRRHNKARIMFDPGGVALRLARAVDTGITATKVPM